MATYALLQIGVPDPEEDHLEVGKVVLKWKTLLFRDAEDRKRFIENNKIESRGSGYPEFDYLEADLETCLRALLPGAVVTTTRSGAWSGYGHGHETITARNGDGTLIYECDRVARCDGPGHSCSYSHGPWFKYGHITGCSVGSEKRLAEAVLRYFDGKYPSTELKKLALKVAGEEVA